VTLTFSPLALNFCGTSNVTCPYVHKNTDSTWMIITKTIIKIFTNIHKLQMQREKAKKVHLKFKDASSISAWCLHRVQTILSSEQYFCKRILFSYILNIFNIGTVKHGPEVCTQVNSFIRTDSENFPETIRNSIV